MAQLVQESSAFTYKVDAGTNSIIITYTGCDECAYGSKEAADACVCHQKCQASFPKPSPDPAVNSNYCQECRDYACNSQCGKYAPKIRKPKEIIITYEVAYAPIPHDPLTYPAAESYDDYIPRIKIPAYATPFISQNIQLKEGVKGKNFCIGFSIGILYDDGTICNHTKIFCYIVG